MDIKEKLKKTRNCSFCLHYIKGLSYCCLLEEKKPTYCLFFFFDYMEYKRREKEFIK